MFIENVWEQLILASAVVIFYFTMFFLLGIFYQKIMKKEKFSFSLTIILGMLTYYVIFELVALPIKIQGWPLHILSCVWMGMLVLISSISVLYNHSFIVEKIGTWYNEKKQNKIFFSLVIVLLLLQVLFILTHSPVIMGVKDDYYYIGDVATSIYKDAVQKYNHFTGEPLNQYISNYFFPLYPMQSAVICQLTGLHPIIENKWSACIVMLIISNMIYYQLAKLVFFDSDKKKIFLTLFFCAIINYNIQSYGVTTGIFYFYRLSEGKGILANIILPCLVYFFARIVKESDNMVNWMMMVVSICCSYTIAMSAMFLVPVSLMGLFVPFLWVKKQWKYVFRVGVCMLPCICILAFYFLISLGYITLTIK